jgi:hypothetical protein
MKKIIIINLLLLIVLISCSTPKLTRRYKEDITRRPEQEVVSIEVNAFSYPVSLKPQQGQNIFNLSDRGQQEYIKAISAKSDAKDLISDLASPLEEKQPISLLDKTTYKRRLVFAIRNKIYRPADRVIKVDLKLSLTDGCKHNIIFTSMDKIVSDYQNVDIGKLTFTQANAFGITPEITTPAAIAGGVSAKIGGSASQSKTLQEEVLLKQRYVASVGTLTDNTVTLMEESVAGVDLIGNLITEVDLKATNIAEKYIFKFKNLFNKQDKPETDNSKIGMERIPVFYPDFNKEDITDYKVWVRKVNKGDDTIQESDDEVEFIEVSGHIPSIKIISKDELKLRTWIIRDSNNLLQIKLEENEKAQDIEFASFDDANTFLKWLKLGKAQKIKENEIWLKDRIITCSNEVFRSLFIQRR